MEGLQIRGLRVEVKDHSVLHNTDLIDPEGEVNLLIGPNGRGKTGLLSTIAGDPQYRVPESSLTFAGRIFLNLTPTEQSRLGVGQLEQLPPAINVVILRMLLDDLSGDDPEVRERMSTFIEYTGMERFLDRHIHEDLSGGEFKGSDLFLLITRQPEFIMLDEPDSGFDMGSLSLLSSMFNRLLSPMKKCPVVWRTGLIITPSRALLDTEAADKAHVMIGSRIVCFGNPGIIMKLISDSGFDSCRFYRYR